MAPVPGPTTQSRPQATDSPSVSQSSSKIPLKKKLTLLLVCSVYSQTVLQITHTHTYTLTHTSLSVLGHEPFRPAHGWQLCHQRLRAAISLHSRRAQPPGSVHKLWLSGTEHPSQSLDAVARGPQNQRKRGGNLEVLTEFITHHALPSPPSKTKRNYFSRQIWKRYATFGYIPLPSLPQEKDPSWQVKCKLCYTKESSGHCHMSYTKAFSLRKGLPSLYRKDENYAFSKQRESTSPFSI